MRQIVGDVGYALRSLRKNPGFALTAIVTLALGIGATTAIFSVVNAVLLKPLPYDDPDKLVRVVQDMRNRNVQDFPIAPGDFFDLREQKMFEGIAAFTTARVVSTPPDGGQAEQLRFGTATPNLFSLLGARITVRAGGESEEAVVLVVALPRKQRREFSQQLLQSFDVVVVNRAARLRGGPVETTADSLVDLGGEVLPARVAVLARDDELRVALGQRAIDARQVGADTRDRRSIAGRDIAREFLGLLTERVERRALGKRLHGNLLS